MILSIGEILYDVFPDGRRLGGAPFNFIYHLRQLGHAVRFVSRVGADAAGRDILARVARAGIDAGDIQIDPDHATGYVQVALDAAGVPTFSIATTVAYDFIAAAPLLSQMVKDPPQLVYFGSLVQRTASGHRRLHEVLEDMPGQSRFFYDMNLRQGCDRRHIISRSLLRADIVKLNEEELATACALLEISGDPAQQVATLIKRFDVGMVAVTRGAAGSSLFVPERRIDVPPMPVARPADTVGAGDAYAAFLADGILSDRPLETAAARAARFSARICEIDGALPETGSFYTAFQQNGEQHEA